MSKSEGSRFGGYGYFLIAGMTWGTIGIFVKFLTGAGSTSAYTTFLRLGFACVILIAITFLREGARAFLVDRKTLVSCFLTALMCQLLYNLAYTAAVGRIGVGCASVLLYVSPFFTACVSALLFKEKITARKWGILAMDIAGCALTAGLLRLNTGLDWRGLLFGVAAGFCYAMTPIFGKLASGRASSMAVTTYTFAFSALMALLMRPWREVGDPLSLRIMLIGFLFALIPTALAYMLYYRGLEKISEPSRIPVLCSVEPVIATILGAALFHEKLYADTLAGIVLVICSVVLLNLPSPAHKTEKEGTGK